MAGYEHPFPGWDSRKSITELKRLVAPYYIKKDRMHDLYHILRIIKAVNRLVKSLKINKIKTGHIILGAYFHGVIKEDKELLRKYLSAHGTSEKIVREIEEAALSSHRDKKPGSLEGKILHDAHILEGEPSFYYQKCIITGLARGEKINDVIKYMEKNILNKNKCCFPETKKELKRRETLAKELLRELKESL